MKRKRETPKPLVVFNYRAPPRIGLGNVGIAKGMFRNRAVGVVGCRTFTDEKIGFQILDEFREHLLNEREHLSAIISGEARGADRIAKNWAKARKIAYTGCPPIGDLSKPSTYHQRNEKIVGFSNILLAFWDMKSPGTRSSIEKARKKGIEVEIVDITKLNSAAVQSDDGVKK